MQNIEFSDFKKLDMRIGQIKTVERIIKSDKLYKLQVDLGEDNTIQIISSLVPYYTAEELLNKNIVVLVNLKPTKFCGELSEGMLLCAENEDGSECVLLTSERGISIGTSIT